MERCFKKRENLRSFRFDVLMQTRLFSRKHDVKGRYRFTKHRRGPETMPTRTTLLYALLVLLKNFPKKRTVLACCSGTCCFGFSRRPPTQIVRELGSTELKLFLHLLLPPPSQRSLTLTLKSTLLRPPRPPDLRRSPPSASPPATPMPRPRPTRPPNCSAPSAPPE